MSELSPEEEAEIRRLLADSALPVSMPTDVSARLDDVLADLVAERAEAEAAPVIPIRRRRWPQVLVAAAAVSLFGFVGANLMAQQSAEMDASIAGDAPNDTSRDEGALESGGSVSPPKASTDSLTRYAARDLRDMLLGFNSVNGSWVAAMSDAIDGGEFNAAQPCGKPVQALAADAYNLRLDKTRQAVVVLQRLNRTAARAYVYPCTQTIIPVSTSLVLGLR